MIKQSERHLREKNISNFYLRPPPKSLMVYPLMVGAEEIEKKKHLRIVQVETLTKLGFSFLAMRMAYDKTIRKAFAGKNCFQFLSPPPPHIINGLPLSSPEEEGRFFQPLPLLGYIGCLV